MNASERIAQLLDSYAKLVKRERRDAKDVTFRPRCKECGLKIGGPNHREGWDHLHRAGKSTA